MLRTLTTFQLDAIIGEGERGEEERGSLGEFTTTAACLCVCLSHFTFIVELNCAVRTSAPAAAPAPMYSGLH